MSDPATAPAASARSGLRAGGADLVSVVRTAARLWLGHWPILLTIALLGGAGRMAALWAAVELSGVSNTLGAAVLVLAPLCSITSIVLLLHVLRGSLPFLAAAGAVRAPVDPTTRRERQLIDMLASVLVPFLAVYASYGLLAEDSYRYRNSIAGKEFTENAAPLFGAGGIDIDRFVFATGWVAAAIVIGAIAVRWGLARLEGRGRSARLGFVGAYVEVVWMMTLAAYLAASKDQAWAWVEGRRAIDIVLSWWLDLLDLVGPAARPLDAVVTWVGGTLGELDDIVVVPLAWLTVGAIVYGHKLAPGPARLPRGGLTSRFDRLPAPVRRWGGELVGQLVGDVRVRFSGLVGGVRRLAVAGLGPMLVFALAFLASARIEDGLQLLVRAWLGPQRVDTWLAFSPHVGTVTRAIGLTITMCLLAAAVDRILGADRAGPRADPADPADIAGHADPAAPAPDPSGQPNASLA
ncbi:hypothetical protein [Pengzhenrongella sicca]|uniref:Uncharacterized protein n=1 Tax=Pengzhenrongella sicca TaxID=2819238 RepID=A0A8A4ZBC1_9MICO|nr:hypothetical protein [Pengzhenrongella sicca]QTE28715.1 hypothetical protein J4E96_15380 [Pengzhenrongella sicca]